MAYPPQGPPAPPHAPQPGAWPPPPAHGAQPGPPQPGPYAQPQPGPYAQPQPGPYAQPQPGPYAQPQPHAQPGAYGQPQFPNPYGQAPGLPPQAPYGASYTPAKPSVAGAVLKLVFGGFFFLACLIATRDTSFSGAMAGVIGGIFTGLFGWMAAAGLWGIVKRTPTPLPIKLGFPLGLGLLGGLIGPPISRAHWESEEADRFDALVTATREDAATASDRWAVEYMAEIDPAFHRPEARGYQLWADAALAADTRNIPGLREVLRAVEAASDPSEAHQSAESVASEALDAIYTDVQAGLTGAAGGGGEFEVDEGLREAFATVLHAMAHEADPVLYVSFSNDVDLAAPNAELDKLLFDEEANHPEMKKAFPDGPPVIAQGDAFSGRFDTKRRDTFIEVLRGSFGTVFEPELLAIEPLDGPRQGKFVLEVHSKVVRQPGYYTLTTDLPGGGVKYEGLLMALAVHWDVRVLDASGKELYAQPPLLTDPAENVGVSRSTDSPTWALYSVVMDSAYYNYGRRLTGMFGLTPPPEKTNFTFE